MRFKQLIKYASHKRKEAEKESVVSVAYWNGYLEALNDALNEEQSGWISVENGLPKKSGRYLVICETIPSPVVRHFKKHFISLQEVTHWMSFPALPKEYCEEHTIYDCIEFERQTKNRDKQIEEMRNDLSEAQEEFGNFCRGRYCQDCEYYFAKTDCKDQIFAEKLVDKGYCKDSDIAREIFDEIERMCIDTFGNFSHRTFAELKKKHMKIKRTEGEG